MAYRSELELESSLSFSKNWSIGWSTVNPLVRERARVHGETLNLRVVIHSGDQRTERVLRSYPRFFYLSWLLIRPPRIRSVWSVTGYQVENLPTSSAPPSS